MIPSINPEEPSSSSSSSEEEDSEDEYREGYEKEDDDSEAENPTVNKTKSGSSHPCPHCAKTFPFPNKLRQHMRIHEVGRYSCKDCSSTNKFNTFQELRNHQKQFHSQAIHKCPQCPYTNSKPVFLRRHFQLNHIDGVPCTIDGCFMKVAKNRMKAHIKQMHSASEPVEAVPKPIRTKLSFHKCPSCEYVPDRSILDSGEQYDDLMRHIRIAHDKQRRKTCMFGCGADLRDEEAEVHWKSCPKLSTEEPSSSTPRLVDDECGDTNTVTSQSVTTETSYGYPDDCDSDTEPGTVELLSNSLLEADLEEGEHCMNEPPKKKIKNAEDQSDIRISCTVCKKSFTKNRDLRKHFNACHSKQKPSRIIGKKFTCERKEKDIMCGKSFRTEQALQDHYNVHDGLKPYACNTCNQRFHARDRFAVHLSKYHFTSIKHLNATESQFGVRRSESKEPSPEPP